MESLVMVVSSVGSAGRERAPGSAMVALGIGARQEHEAAHSAD